MGARVKWFLPFVVLVLALAGWHSAVRHWQVPAYVVPAPAAVWAAAVEHGDELWRATAVTAGAAILGLLASALLGTTIGFLFAQWPLLRRSFYPYAIFLQTVPMVAIAPLIVLWCGPGFASIVVITCVVSIFPMITSTTAGLSVVDRELVELFRVYDASAWTTFWKLRLPNAVPHLVAGAQAAGGLAVVGAIAGEVFAGAGATAHGLGYLITATAAQLKTAYLFAAILSSTLLGLGVFGTLAMVRHLLTARWLETSS